MYGIWIGCLLLTVVYGEDIILKPGEVYTYTIRDYPNTKLGQAGNQIFNFRSSPGSKIVTFCTDFRMLTTDKPPCDLFEMTVSDGSVEKKFCKNYEDVNFKSEGSTMTVEMKYSVGGLVSCVARSTEQLPPTKIVVKPDTTETIQEPSELIPFYDETWEFTSSNNAHISLECYNLMTKETPCRRNSLIVDDGKIRKVTCEEQDVFNVVSTENKITVRAILNEHGRGRFRCIASLKQQEKKQDNYKQNENDNESTSPNSQQSFNLKAGKVVSVEKPKNSVNGQEKYEFNSSPGSKVHIFCNAQTILKENFCQNLEISVDDGIIKERYCREKKYFNYFSKGSTVNMIVKYSKSERFQCFARSDETTDLTEVELDVTDGLYAFNHPQPTIPWLSRSWNIKTVPGTKLSLQCDISITSFENGNVCTHDLISVNDGETDRVYCGAKHIVLFSKGTELQVKVHSSKDGHFSYFCRAQTVTGPDPNQVNNLKIEDSAENAGEAPGRLGTTCQCGMRNNKQLKAQGRIFYGKQTKEGEFPWMASIRNPGTTPRCGGSIITEYHVLTAAHCMVNDKTRKKNEIQTDTVVFVGAYHLYLGASHGQTKGYEVKETHIPEPWWQRRRPHDIAVLVLKEKIVFSQFVSPVCLAPNPIKLVNKAIRAIGWGMTEDKGSPTYLLTTKLFVRSRYECSNQDEIICTVNKQSSVCYGDSGGPLAYVDPDTNRYTQIGVASYVTPPYCQSSSGFANVTYHLKYINDIIKRTMPSARICTKAN